MRFVDDQAIETPANDAPNKRYIHTKWGFSILLERRDPYGFVHIVWPKGPTPNSLSGAYSTFEYATIALTQYLNNETFNEVVAEPVEPVKPLKLKKAA